MTALFLTALAGALAGCAAEQAEETPSAVQLEAPGNFTLTERELNWDAVPHAAMYAIEFSEEHYTTRQTYYVLPELTGEVTVRVMAYGDGIDYLDSEWAEYSTSVSSWSGWICPENWGLHGSERICFICVRA